MSTATTTKQRESLDSIVIGLDIEKMLGKGASINISYVVNSEGNFNVSGSGDSTYVFGPLPADLGTEDTQLTQEEQQKLIHSISTFYSGEKATHEEVMEILK